VGSHYRTAYPTLGTRESKRDGGSFPSFSSHLQRLNCRRNRAVSEATKTSAAPTDWSLSLQIFLCLQVLDALTTLVGFRLGLVEASPFIQFLMHLGPIAGVVGSKILAVALGGLCVWRGLPHIIRLINFWYAGLVIWNLTLIMTR